MAKVEGLNDHNVRFGRLRAHVFRMRRQAVAADEIFVLMLVLVCVATVVVMSFRSRRAQAVANPEPSVPSEAEAIVEKTGEPAVRPRRRKNR